MDTWFKLMCAHIKTSIYINQYFSSSWYIGNDHTKQVKLYSDLCIAINKVFKNILT